MRTGIALLWVFAMAFAADSHAAGKAPPLIVEPDLYSYSLGIPSGWDFSFEQAREFGVRLVFFQDGATFHSSDSVMYVKELCQRKCTGRLRQEISDVLENARARDPNITVSEGGPITAKSGATAQVRILIGAKDPRRAKEALAFLEYREAVVLVVLSTKTPPTGSRTMTLCPISWRSTSFLRARVPTSAFHAGSARSAT